jgi:hypothetical protein
MENMDERLIRNTRLINVDFCKRISQGISILDGQNTQLFFFVHMQDKTAGRYFPSVKGRVNSFLPRTGV